MSSNERIRVVTTDLALSDMVEHQAGIMRYLRGVIAEMGACSTKAEVSVILKAHYDKDLDRAAAVKQAAKLFKDERKG